MRSQLAENLNYLYSCVLC